MSCAVYIRVSSPRQKTDSQHADIRRWLTAHGHARETVQWFEDQERGTTLHRAGLQALSEAIGAGTVTTVVVWKLDRLARSMREGINLLSAWCDAGVRVVSVTQQLDLSGTVGHLVAGVLFAIAEIELQQTKERQAAGIAAARQRGVYKGRAKGTTKAMPQRAWALKDQGLTGPEIAKALGVGESTVWRYLKMRPAPQKVMQVALYLRVENNSTFVRGKTRSLQEIEDEVLSRYGMDKPASGRPDYLLTIPYETDDELDRTIYDDILAEAHHIADLRNGFIEYDMWEVDNPERSW
jgi:DNA invertase Pin-like site-specific DNA recombinase